MGETLALTDTVHIIALSTVEEPTQGCKGAGTDAAVLDAGSPATLFC